MRKEVPPRSASDASLKEGAHLEAPIRRRCACMGDRFRAKPRSERLLIVAEPPALSTAPPVHRSVNLARIGLWRRQRKGSATDGTLPQ